MSLELCHPKTKVIFGDNNQYDKRNSLRLFNKRNHRTRIGLVNENEVRDALSEYGEFSGPTYMQEIQIKPQEIEIEQWIKRSLFPGEFPSDYDILLLHSQENGWYKICLQTKKEFTNGHKWLFRSFLPRNPVEYKTLKESQEECWFVDPASLEADKQFWTNLRDI